MRTVERALNRDNERACVDAAVSGDSVRRAVIAQPESTCTKALHQHEAPLGVTSSGAVSANATPEREGG